MRRTRVAIASLWFVLGVCTVPGTAGADRGSFDLHLVQARPSMSCQQISQFDDECALVATAGGGDGAWPTSVTVSTGWRSPFGVAPASFTVCAPDFRTHTCQSAPAGQAVVFPRLTTFTILGQWRVTAYDANRNLLPVTSADISVSWRRDTPVVQGYKVDAWLSQFNIVPVQVGATSFSGNPYGTGVAANTTYTASSPIPPGYVVSHSQCVNCADGVAPSFTPGNQATGTMNFNGVTDIWWMYRQLPTGDLDVRAQPTTTTFTGWVFDPTFPSTSLTIRVWLDVSCPVFSQSPPAGMPASAPLLTLTSDVVRGDVNAAFGISGAHGFSFTVPLAALSEPASHAVCIWAAGADPLDGAVNLSASGNNVIQGFGCSPSNCASGCCTADGSRCLGTSDNGCGSGGGMCAVCGADETCSNHACVPMVPPDPPEPFDCSQCRCDCNASGTACRPAKFCWEDP